MARVLSQRTRQALLDLEGIFDPTRMPERLALFDSEGNLINLQGISGMPLGGLTSHILTKKSDADFDTEWAPPSVATQVIPLGGTTGQVLAKDSDDDYDMEWIDPPGPEELFEWDSGTTYAIGDKVTYNDEIWVAISTPTVGVAPDGLVVPGPVNYNPNHSGAGWTTSQPCDFLSTTVKNWSAANFQSGVQADYDYFYFDVTNAGNIKFKITLTSGNGEDSYLFNGNTGQTVVSGINNYVWTNAPVGRHYIRMRGFLSAATGTIVIEEQGGTVSKGVANPAWETTPSPPARDGTAMHWKGPWSSSVQYVRGDVVSYTSELWHAPGDMVIGSIPPSDPTLVTFKPANLSNPHDWSFLSTTPKPFNVVQATPSENGMAYFYFDVTTPGDLSITSPSSTNCYIDVYDSAGVSLGASAFSKSLTGLTTQRYYVRIQEYQTSAPFSGTIVVTEGTGKVSKVFAPRWENMTG
jgi:hypothetical protein